MDNLALLSLLALAPILVVGVLLGGTLGPATVVYALAIGPLVQPLLPWLTVAPAGGNTGRTTGLHPGTRP